MSTTFLARPAFLLLVAASVFVLCIGTAACLDTRAPSWVVGSLVALALLALLVSVFLLGMLCHLS